MTARKKETLLYIESLILAGIYFAIFWQKAELALLFGKEQADMLLYLSFGTALSVAAAFLTYCGYGMYKAKKNGTKAQKQD